jgi:hypothetical protein
MISTILKMGIPLSVSPTKIKMALRKNQAPLFHGVAQRRDQSLYALRSAPSGVCDGLFSRVSLGMFRTQSV